MEYWDVKSDTARVKRRLGNGMYKFTVAPVNSNKDNAFLKLSILTNHVSKAALIFDVQHNGVDIKRTEFKTIFEQKAENQRAYLSGIGISTIFFLIAFFISTMLKRSHSSQRDDQDDPMEFDELPTYSRNPSREQGGKRNYN